MSYPARAEGLVNIYIGLHSKNSSLQLNISSFSSQIMNFHFVIAVENFSTLNCVIRTGLFASPFLILSSFVPLHLVNRQVAEHFPSSW